MGNSCDMRVASASAPGSEPWKTIPWESRSKDRQKPRPYTPRNPPRNGRANTLLSVSQAFLPIVDYFEPIYQHYILTLPLCRAYRQQTVHCRDIWMALLVAPTLSVPLPWKEEDSFVVRSSTSSLGSSLSSASSTSSLSSAEATESEPSDDGDNDTDPRENEDAVAVPSSAVVWDPTSASSPNSRRSRGNSGTRRFRRRFGWEGMTSKSRFTNKSKISSPERPKGTLYSSRSSETTIGDWTPPPKPSSGMEVPVGDGVWAVRAAFSANARALHLDLSRALFSLSCANAATTYHGGRSPPCNLPVLEDVLRRAVECPTIEAQCMDSLNVALEDEGTRTTAQQGNIPSLLFRTMRRWPEDEALLSRALYTAMLLLRPKGGSEGCLFKGDEMCSLRVAAVVEEGVSVVFEAMKRHRRSRRLQYMGCWAMVNMALEVTHKTKLLQEGAIGVVCEAMDAHADDPKVQFRALFALINLVTIAGVSQTESVESAEALTVRVVSATRRFLKCLDVAGRGCMVLYNLSLDSANHGFLTRLRVPGLLQAAAAAHPRDSMLEFVASSTASRLGTSAQLDIEGGAGVGPN